MELEEQAILVVLPEKKNSFCSSSCQNKVWDSDLLFCQLHFHYIAEICATQFSFFALDLDYNL